MAFLNNFILNKSDARFHQEYCLMVCHYTSDPSVDLLRAYLNEDIFKIFFQAFHTYGYENVKIS